VVGGRPSRPGSPYSVCERGKWNTYLAARRAAEQRFLDCLAAVTIAACRYAASVYREAAAADKYDPRTTAHRSHP
jgi:hypothetical protein